VLEEIEVLSWTANLAPAVRNWADGVVVLTCGVGGGRGGRFYRIGEVRRNKQTGTGLMDGIVGKKISMLDKLETYFRWIENVLATATDHTCSNIISRED
jgi:hypothetical protein